MVTLLDNGIITNFRHISNTNKKKQPKKNPEKKQKLVKSMVNVKNTATSTFTGKKPSKPLQNTLFYALVSIICEEKPLITTNKLAGPVGKKEVLGGVYRLQNACKTTKKLTEPVTK